MIAVPGFSQLWAHTAPDRVGQIAVGGQRAAWRGADLEEAAREIARFWVEEHRRLTVSLAFLAVTEQAVKLVNRLSGIRRRK